VAEFVNSCSLSCVKAYVRVLCLFCNRPN